MAVEAVKNWPILEALCEFQFSKDKEWDWTIPGIIYEQVREHFPIKKQESVAAFLIDGKTKKISPQQGSIDKMRFIRKDESALIQVGPHLFVANQLNPYPGWETYKELIFNNLNIFIKAAEPTGIDRIGLRYINRFNIDDIKTDIFDHFYIKPQVPLDRPMKNFFLRSELLYDEIDSTLVITLGNQHDPDQNKNFIILDFDIFSTNKDLISLSSCSNWIEKAHDFLDEAFHSCISEILRHGSKEE